VSLTGTNLNFAYGYTANSNSLLTVQDTDAAGWFKNPVSTSNEYGYNPDGSLTRDDNKGISSIVYNFLGKPQTVNFTSGKKVEYVYDAAGMKLTMKTWQGTTLQSTTHYAGGFVYEGNTPALSYFSSPEGRVVKNGSNYEYQYAIADHQGNTRVVFTSATPTPTAYTANMEGATNSNFSNYTNRVNFELYDHTDVSGTTYTYSQKLTGAAGQQVGVAKSFKVYPGDKIKIEAYAKYMASSGASNLSGFATALLSAFGYSAPGVGETGTARAAVNSWGGVVAGGGGNGSSSYPKAFVNLLVVDKNYNFIDAAWDQLNGGEQIGASPKAAHDYLMQEYVAREEGYIYVYVSNESASLVEVYFDDVTVTHTPGNVIQASEYYPYGVQAATSWTRENNLGNNFLYNGGTELNKTTQVYDLYYRNYDPVLGRFGQVDPMASQFASLTPYNYGNNDPVLSLIHI
jgi:RHS repeat-associated protein